MASTKTCPFCAERIQRSAVVCRFCGRDLPPAPAVPTLEERRAAAAEIRAASLALPWWRRREVRIVLGAVGGLVAAIIAVTAVLAATPEKDKPDTPEYLADKAYCEDLATRVANDSSGLYAVGGSHWVGLVNSCLTTRADDRGGY